ncbi:MAG: MmgE/PrpD family protein [Deltaproteobacteria bacterium]|nr:MmgE/PrpD family protein [Deltaproteobacteria bacterium]
MKTLAQRLADFVVETQYEDLPLGVVHEAKRVLVDSIGCGVAGMTAEKGRLSAALARRLGGPPESSILGTRDRVSCAAAAFANGELINALDFDAVLEPAIHVSPFVLPPALALGESKGASGRDLIVASVLGHELSARVASGLSSGRTIVAEGPDRGKVLRPAVHGYSANAFGSVASAGKMLNLEADKMANAIGIAGYSAPMQTGSHWQRCGTSALIKYGSAGWMAQLGATAALLADTGYTGDLSVLDADDGFWRFSGSESWSPEKVSSNLGQDWHILNMRYKVYPCCGIIQGSLDCITAIVHENSLAPEEIGEVKVWLDPLSEQPLWQSRQIDNEVQAQFSVPYVVAVAAHGLALGAEWQDPDTRKSPRIAGFMDKVSFATHPDYGRAALEDGNARMARVDVQARGRTYTVERSYARGAATPEIARLSDRELEEKFRQNTSGLLPQDRVDKALKSIWELEEMKNLSHLMEALAR